MNQVSQSVAIRVRFPRETLAALDRWASHNKLPRSIAVRRLMLTGLASWEDDEEGLEQSFADLEEALEEYLEEAVDAIAA